MKKVYIQSILMVLILSSYSIQAQVVGIGTNTPDQSAKLHIVDPNRGLLIPNISIGNVGAAAPVTTPATGLLVWNTNAAITGGTGTGFYYWDGAQWVNLEANITAENGLYVAGTGAIRQGGPLIENTTITQGGFNMIHNLDGLGDFIVQDAGINQFVVQDNGDVRADNNSLYVDASTDRVGVGTITPTEDFHVYRPDTDVARVYATGTTQGSGMFYAGQSTTYGGGFVYDGDGTPALVGATDRLTFFRRSAGVDTDVMSFSYNNSTLRVADLAGVGNRMVIADVNGDLSTQAIPANGDITGVNAGTGLTGGGTAGTVTLNAAANNGLHVDAGADRIQLGGALVEGTTITQGVHTMTYNLNGTGDFRVQDNGNNRFIVLDNGRVEMNGTADASGATNTGVLEIANALRLDGNEIITNTNAALYLQNGNNGDLIVDNPTMIVDASIDVVRFGSATSALTNNAGTFPLTRSGTTITVDYVADFDHGTVNGSTMGLGSVEYLVDGANELFISDDFTPTGNLSRDLGWENFWDDVYADDYWIPSDVRLKHDIKELNYGLKEILALEPISYVLNDDPFGDTKLGLKAQQILTLVPEAVKTHDHKQLDESKPGVYTEVELNRMAVSYQTLIPVLIKAVQEQQVQIEALKAEVKELRK